MTTPKLALCKLAMYRPAVASNPQATKLIIPQTLAKLLGAVKWLGAIHRPCQKIQTPSDESRGGLSLAKLADAAQRASQASPINKSSNGAQNAPSSPGVQW